MRKLKFSVHSQELWTMPACRQGRDYLPRLPAGRQGSLALRGGLWTILLLFSVLCILLSGIGCEKKKMVKEKPPMPVEVYAVELCPLQEKLFYVGDIKAQEQIKVFPKVTGKIIKNIVKENDKVNKDQPLALIDRDEVGFKYQPSPVVSPISGVVGRIYLDKGETVSPNTAIAEVVNMENVKVKVNVVERELPKIKEGQICQIKVDPYPDEIFEGKVVTVSPIVDLFSRTAPIEIEIPNSDYQLKPGMFARIWIIVQERPAVLCLPRDAILKEDNLTFVMLVIDEKVEKRKVSLGMEENNKIEVIEGLKENDLVVTMGKELLEDRDLVKVIK